MARKAKPAPKPTFVCVENVGPGRLTIVDSVTRSQIVALDKGETWTVAAAFAGRIEFREEPARV